MTGCESAFGVKSCTKPYPKGHPPLYGSAFQASPTRGATTPLIVTAVLNSTQAADFRTGGVPGSEKPTPARPKGDRRSVLSEKEIQDSDNCSCLHMGCICCYYQINNCTVPQGCKGREVPLELIYYGVEVQAMFF